MSKTSQRIVSKKNQKNTDIMKEIKRLKRLVNIDESLPDTVKLPLLFETILESKKLIEREQNIEGRIKELENKLK